MSFNKLFTTKLYWVPLLFLFVITSCKDSFNFKPSLESLTVEKMVDADEFYLESDYSTPCFSVMATKKGFMCIGFYYSSETDENINTLSVWDNDGNHIQTNEFGNSENLFTDVREYIESSDGSIIALDILSSTISAYKFNAEGELIWKKELFSRADYNFYSISLFEDENNYIVLASDNELQTKHSKFKISKDGSEVNEEVTESDFRRFTVHRISNKKAIYIGANTESLSAIVKIANVNGGVVKEKEYPTTSVSTGLRLEKSRSYLLMDNQSRVYKTDNDLEIEWDTGLTDFNYFSSGITETEAGNILYNGRNNNIYLYSIEGDKLDEYTTPPNNLGSSRPVKLTNGNIVFSSYDYETTQLIFLSTRK